MWWEPNLGRVNARAKALSHPSFQPPPTLRELKKHIKKYLWRTKCIVEWKTTCFTQARAWV